MSHITLAWRPRVRVNSGSAEHYRNEYLKRIEIYEIDREGEEHRVEPERVADMRLEGFEAWKPMRVVVKLPKGPAGREGFLLHEYEPVPAKDVIMFAREVVEEAAKYGNARKALDQSVAGSGIAGVGSAVFFQERYNQRLVELERKFLVRRQTH